MTLVNSVQDEERGQGNSEEEMELLSIGKISWKVLPRTCFDRNNNYSRCVLKVPKCEIFDRSDFPDFYTIKSLRVGDFGVKIKKNFKNI